MPHSNGSAHNLMATFVSRELGQYLLENGLGQFESSRLLQLKVRTADDQQVLEWALQHELSRGLHLVLRSAVLSPSPDLTDFKLAVEVRNTTYQAPAATTTSSSSPSMIDAPVDSRSSKSAGAMDLASNTGLPTVALGSSASDNPGATEADKRRRLYLYVGNGRYSTGYELSSAASAAALKDHVQRNVKYRDQHSCRVFAVNLQRPKRPRSCPPKDASPPSEGGQAQTLAELKEAMENFASWPKERPDKVCNVVHATCFPNAKNTSHVHLVHYCTDAQA